MRLTSILLILAVSLIPALARAETPDVKELEHSTKVFTDCAKIADEIAAMKVPEGHAEARAQKASHDHPEAKGEKVKIEPVHEQFMKDMDEKTARLDACGKDYEVAVKESEALTEKLGKANMSEQEATVIKDQYMAYDAAKQKLRESLHTLTREPQIQSYVHKILLEHFLKDHKKKA
jgi:hypothetical protein